MKKKVLIALSLIAAMCIGTQVAYAAPSPTASDTSILAEAVDVIPQKAQQQHFLLTYLQMLTMLRESLFRI